VKKYLLFAVIFLSLSHFRESKWYILLFLLNERIIVDVANMFFREEEQEEEEEV
jgi:hypothetical protein